MKRKVYTSRGERQGDFAIGFIVVAVLLLAIPALIANLGLGDPSGAWAGPVLALLFVIGAAFARPWMALGGLGCLGLLIGLGFLVAIFIAVTCSTGFR